MNMNVIEFVLSDGFSTDRELLGSPTVSTRGRHGPSQAKKREVTFRDESGRTPYA